MSGKIRLAGVVLAGIAMFALLVDWDGDKVDVMSGYWQDGRMQPAPDFTLPALGGGELSLSDYRGKIVVLNFWATWCGPCRDEMPAFVGMQNEFGPRGVQFIGVSIDSGGFDAIADFAAEFGANYPLVHDDMTVYDSYEGTTAVPTTYLITRKGEIWFYMPGPLSREALAPALEGMLEREPA
ncbi:MAG: peroxiredoxin [Rhodothermales bacterium]|jgi:peroxiredoxin